MKPTAKAGLAGTFAKYGGLGVGLYVGISIADIFLWYGVLKYGVDVRSTAKK